MSAETSAQFVCDDGILRYERMEKERKKAERENIDVCVCVQCNQTRTNARGIWCVYSVHTHTACDAKERGIGENRENELKHSQSSE